MTEVEQNRNEEALEALHRELLCAIGAKDEKKIQVLTEAIQKLESTQTENEKVMSDWNAKCMQIEQSDKQFKTQVVTTVSGFAAMGVLGWCLEKFGTRVSVEPLKVFVKGITDSIVKPFRR